MQHVAQPEPRPCRTHALDSSNEPHNDGRYKSHIERRGYIFAQVHESMVAVCVSTLLCKSCAFSGVRR